MTLKAEVKQLLQGRAYEPALARLLEVRASDPPELVEYAATALEKIPETLLQAHVSTHKKLAVLGGATTQFLLPLIRFFALKRGVFLSLYESGFGLFEQEVWADSPALHDFAPDVIHFHVCTKNLSLALGGADATATFERERGRFLQLYRAASERFGCTVIANNFETESERPFGSVDSVLPSTRNSIIRRLNAALASALPPQVFLHDVEMLSARAGKLRWFDPRLWNSAKLAVNFECQPLYADSLAAALGASFGKSKKCLVLDLDNTLWGGVIGDDGLGGIALGTGQPDGEAFVEFQQYVKALKERGVLLAVASKNDPENALAPFREHTDMVLRENDISCFVANWEPKDGNLGEIARRLNIGLDSFVFFDDNPAERELIRRNLPMVEVIEVPRDASLYVRALDDANWFDTLSVTDEDRLRSDFFQGNQARDELERSAGSYEDYLRQLEMSAIIEPIHEGNLSRVTQLINKTNQFNLVTRRMTEAEVKALIGNPEYYTGTTRLKDKFGDNGLISIVIGRIGGDSLHIENWLMSCRVLKRGVELLEMERVLEFCRARRLASVHGRYVPTAKNKLVKDHYTNLGFQALATDGDETSWTFDVSTGPTQNHTIVREQTSDA